MKRLLLFCSLGLVLMFACGGKNKKTNANSDKVYENEYFRLKYPAGWICDEEISSDEIDSFLIVSKAIRVTLYNESEDVPWHVVMVQKSSMPNIFKTAEGWRNLSVFNKQENGSYLAMFEEEKVDSLVFNGWPAATAAFLAINEDGDTIVHKQVVVMVDEQVYYLNNSFSYHDDGECEQLGDYILRSIRFKAKDKK